MLMVHSSPEFSEKDVLSDEYMDTMTHVDHVIAKILNSLIPLKYSRVFTPT